MSNNLPSFSNYGQYASENYGVNTLVFDMPNIRVYFSYKTPIAFIDPSGNHVIRKNDWGPTTGKHLNWINPDKSIRISGAEFKKKLAKAIA